MQRTHVFIIFLTISLCSLVLLLAASLYLAATSPSPYYSSWMPQMWNGMGMNGMMGGNPGYQTQTSPSYLWIIPAGLIGIVAVSVIGLGFYLAFPQIKTTTENPETLAKQSFLSDPKNAGISENTHTPSNPYEAVSKTLTPEELKVLNILVANNGRYLQKYIRKETELSRLKTRRIIARFAERGIVTLKQSGNTNEIFLADWLKDSKPHSAV